MRAADCCNPNRRRLLLAAAGMSALSAVSGLAGCAGLVGPQTLTLSEAELNALIGRAFPLQRRVLELLDVQMSAPQLRLLPDVNRLAVALVVSTQDRVFGRSARGSLRFDAALRWDAAEATIRLAQVRVQQLRLDGGSGTAALEASQPPTPQTPQTPQIPQIPSPPAPPVGVGDPGAMPASNAARLGLALAERALEDLPLYRLSPERQARLRQLGLQPGTVRVTAAGLQLILVPLGS